MADIIDVVLYALEIMLFLSICWLFAQWTAPKSRKTDVFTGGEKVPHEKIKYSSPMTSFVLLFLALDGALFLLLLSLDIAFTPIPYVLILLVTLYPLFHAGERIA